MIEAVGLTKRYGDKTAVYNLSFQVRPGTVTGFLGPNGSGKSTTMRMILGLDNPTSGQVTIGGFPYRRLPNAARQVGALLDAKAVHGLGVEQRTDLPGRVGQPAVREAADRHLAGRGVVQPQDHPHGRRLARAVGAQEAGDGAGPHLEGQVVHSGLVAVALGQADCFDHAPHPSQGSGQRGTRPP